MRYFTCLEAARELERLENNTRTFSREYITKLIKRGIIKSIRDKTPHIISESELFDYYKKRHSKDK